MRDAVTGRSVILPLYDSIVLWMLPPPGTFRVLYRAPDPVDGRTTITVGEDFGSLPHAKYEAVRAVTEDADPYPGAFVINELGETLYDTDEVEQ